MAESRFSIGDSIEFELRTDGNDGTKPYPRWDNEVDFGASGVFLAGVVDEVDPMGGVIVSYLNPETGWCDYWQFPALSAATVRPGWVRARRVTVICECGAQAVWGALAPHSDWCPAFATASASAGGSR